MSLSSILASIKDTLFPKFCLGCKTEGDWLCNNCLNFNAIKPLNCCPVCYAICEGVITCNCAKKVALKGVTTLFDYNKDPLFSDLIQKFKYNYVKDLQNIWELIIAKIAKNLGQQIVSGINNKSFLLNNLSILPIPLHPRRYRERGYNQANVISQILAKNLGSNYYGRKGLIRQKYTGQQAKLTRAERLKNVANAFAWQQKTPPPEAVLLVDDVFTTGATMQACANILKQNGSKLVWGFALARD